MTRPWCRASFNWKEISRNGFLLSNTFHTLWHKIAPNCTRPATAFLFGRRFHTSRSQEVMLLLISPAHLDLCWLRAPRRGKVDTKVSMCESSRLTEWKDLIKDPLFMKHYKYSISFCPHTGPVRCQTSIRSPTSQMKKQRSLTMIPKRLG